MGEVTTHHCPVAGCKNDHVERAVMMCARHWRMVPKPLREAIYASYNETDQTAYQHNRSEALRVVAEMETGCATMDVPAGTRALTIFQPWATLVMMKAKPHEFRKWDFTDKPAFERLVGQRIVVHASARPMKLAEVNDIINRIDAEETDLNGEIARPYLYRLWEMLRAKDTTIDALAPRAAALGTVILGRPKNVVELFRETMPDSDRLDHHMYGWPMIDPVALARPIPTPGSQGFWKWS